MAADGTIKISTELDSDKAQSAMSKFSSTAKTAMKGVTVAIGVASTALTAMAGYAIKVGSDFEQGMSNVAAISGATGEELDKLTEKAKEMGAKTKFSAQESAEAFEYMAMAGWKTEDMLNGIEGIMNLAAASGESLATTSDIVTDALTAFGLTAADSTHFADVLAQASSNANTNVGMMGETFKYVAPVAGSLGFSAEDCAVAIGLMANSGIKAGQAGTSLRQIFTNLVKPTDQMQTAMDELGISITDAGGNTKSLDALMGDLRNSFSGLTDSQKAQYAATIAGQEGMSALLAIVNASETDFNALKDSIYNADGAAQEMAETMQDNLKGAVEELVGGLETFAIQVYEKMEGPLRGAVEYASECVDRLSAAFESGGLTGVVSKAGDIFDELTDSIADTSEEANGIITPLKNMTGAMASIGKGAAPIAVETIKLLARNMDKLIPIASACFAAVKVYGPAMKAAATATKANAAATAILNKMEKANALQLVATNGGLTVRQILMGVHNGQLTIGTAATALFTKAQLALNTAMSANPIGFVVTAIAALTAGIAAAVIVSDKDAEATAKLSKEQKDLCKSIDETSEKVKQLKESRDENIQSATKEIDTTSALWVELQNLVDENGKVKAGYEARAEYITGQLSQALGVEMQLQDGIIQGYSGQIDTINKLIETQRAQASLEAMEDSYKEAVQGKTEALTGYLQAQQESTKAGKELSDAQSELAAITAQANEETKQYGVVQSDTKVAQEEAQEAVDQLSKNYDKLSGKTKDAKNSYEEYQDIIKQYEGLSAAIVSGDSNKIQEALLAIQADFKKFGEVSNDELKNQAINASNNMALLGDAIKNGWVDSKDSAVAEIANMTAMSLGELAKLPGGAATVAGEINPAMLGELVSLSGSLNDESKKAVTGFLEGLDGVDDKTRDAFENAVKGAIEGSEFGDEVSSKAKEMGISYLDALKEVLEVHSPSQAVKRIFAQAMPGAAEGLEEGKEGVLEKAGSFVTEFLGKFQNGGIGETLKEVGKNAMALFGVGVSEQQENSRLAGKLNADAANAGASSVDPSPTGGLFGSLFGGGIGGMIGFLFGQGKGLSDSANSGAGSVNPAPTGSNFGSQYASGVGSKTGEANLKGQALADNAESGANTADGYSIGSNFGSGFVSGIGDWIVSAATKAAELAASAYNAAKRWLDEHSPSKKTAKLGKWFSQGLGVGIADGEGEVVEASEKVSQSALDALDMDTISMKLKDIDIPGTMARINLAIDDQQTRVSDKVVSAAEAKERSNTAELISALSKSMEIDYKQLGQEMSKRPIYLSAELDKRQVIKLLALPMDQEQQRNNNFKKMLNGGRP